MERDGDGITNGEAIEVLVLNRLTSPTPIVHVPVYPCFSLVAEEESELESSPRARLVSDTARLRLDPLSLQRIEIALATTPHHWSQCTAGHYGRWANTLDQK